jgi:hypothetical protein
VGECRRLGAGVERGEDVRDVPLDGAMADEQLVADLAVGPAMARSASNVAFAGPEPEAVGRGRCRPLDG